MRKRNALEIAKIVEDDLPQWRECKEAAAMIREQHAEIKNLKELFARVSYAHVPGCTREWLYVGCVGCESVAAHAAHAEITRLEGENSVLRDLLSDTLILIDKAIDGEAEDEDVLYRFKDRISAAIYGPPAGLLP